MSALLQCRRCQEGPNSQSDDADGFRARSSDIVHSADDALQPEGESVRIVFGTGRVADSRVLETKSGHTLCREFFAEKSHAAIGVDVLLAQRGTHDHGFSDSS